MTGFAGPRSETATTNDRAVQEFRANSGWIGGELAGIPVLLVHHRGARSGIDRVTPLVYTPDGADGYLVVASNGGSRAHPGWYHNLTAHPLVQVEVGAETFAARAQELGDERDRVWPALVAAQPVLASFQAVARRRIPVLRLRRAARRGPTALDLESG